MAIDTPPCRHSSLWNFIDVDVVEIGRQFFGGVLAPNADVTTGQDFYGTLVGNNVTLRGQMHVPVTEAPPVTTTVPSPIAAGPAVLACLALLLRRRREPSAA